MSGSQKYARHSLALPHVAGVATTQRHDSEALNGSALALNEIP
jgi:hypothetical protein